MFDTGPQADLYLDPTTGERACCTASLVDALSDSHREVGRAQRRFLAHLAAVDATRVWVDDDCRSMGHWVAVNFGIPSHRAARMVAAGHALRDLPLIADALCDGTLSLDKVVELCRFATPQDERKLISWARRVSVAAVRDRADLACRKDMAEVKDHHNARRLEWWWDQDGMLALYGLLPSDKGAKVARALDRLASRIATTPENDPDPATCASQKRADALVQLASQAIAADPDPDRATVVVHVPVTTLASGDANGVIASGPVIAPEVARGLCCYSRMEYCFEDSIGRVVGLGRGSRTLTPQMSRALRARDSDRCTFPGCGHRRALVEHHIDWWGPGDGHTDLDKMLLVCPAHHDLIHKHGWNVRLKDGVEAQWFRPDGREFVPGPSP